MFFRTASLRLAHRRKAKKHGDPFEHERARTRAVQKSLSLRRLKMLNSFRVRLSGYVGRWHLGSCMMRAAGSVEPPGGKGTMILTGSLGQSAVPYAQMTTALANETGAA